MLYCRAHGQREDSSDHTSCFIKQSSLFGLDTVEMSNACIGVKTPNCIIVKTPNWDVMPAWGLHVGFRPGFQVYLAYQGGIQTLSGTFAQDLSVIQNVHFEQGCPFPYFSRETAFLSLQRKCARRESNQR